MHKISVVSSIEKEYAMREFTCSEVRSVSGGDGGALVVAGAGCIGGGIMLVASEGLLATTGLAVATAGACFDFGWELEAIFAVHEN
jgi:hypothetical protein